MFRSLPYLTLYTLQPGFPFWIPNSCAVYSKTPTSDSLRAVFGSPNRRFRPAGRIRNREIVFLETGPAGTASVAQRPSRRFASQQLRERPPLCQLCRGSGRQGDAVLYRHNIPRRLAGVDLPRTGDLLLGVGDHFLPLG